MTSIPALNMLATGSDSRHKEVPIPHVPVVLSHTAVSDQTLGHAAIAFNLSVFSYQVVSKPYKEL